MVTTAKQVLDTPMGANYADIVVAPIRVLALPCVDEAAARAFVAWLRGEEVDVNGVDGRNVLIPTSYPPFAWDVAESANEHGWAHDDEACAAVGAFLEEAGCR